MKWNDQDLKTLKEHGLPSVQADSQLARLQGGFLPLRLESPCDVENGVTCLSSAEQENLIRLYDEQIIRRKAILFVPASGAGSRMFELLITLPAIFKQGPPTFESIRSHPVGAPLAGDWLQFLNALPRMPFYQDLAARFPRVMSANQDPACWSGLLDCLLEPSGLNFKNLPKGSIPFHHYAQGARTAFEEHLREGLLYLAHADGGPAYHFTVSPADRDTVRAELTACASELGVPPDNLSFSCQESDTDTLALDADGHPFRQADGTLLFRPGGHGALLPNLGRLNAGLVFIRNIDNNAQERFHIENARWQKILGGMLLSAQAVIHRFLDALEAGALSPDQRQAICEFVTHTLGYRHPPLPSPASPDFANRAREFFHRPLRVCGVVRNTGEPGGAPFWIQGQPFPGSPQIVEHAQIDTENMEQLAIFNKAPYFNPVHLVLGLIDHRGTAFNPSSYADPETTLITHKTKDGRSLMGLEHPGLWNGGMAHWLTVLVEIPAHTFHPVKTVMDLLRPDHQPSGDSQA